MLPLTDSPNWHHHNLHHNHHHHHNHQPHHHHKHPRVLPQPSLLEVTGVSVDSIDSTTTLPQPSPPPPPQQPPQQLLQDSQPPQQPPQDPPPSPLDVTELPVTSTLISPQLPPQSPQPAQPPTPPHVTPQPPTTQPPPPPPQDSMKRLEWSESVTESRRKRGPIANKWLEVRRTSSATPLSRSVSVSPLRTTTMRRSSAQRVSRLTIVPTRREIEICVHF